MAEIRIENLHKRFADFVAVRDSSLVLEDGKFVVLLGPSGCGKTTTLRMLAGLEFPTSGTITLDGQDVTYLRPRERDIAMVFQLFALYPHMGVRGNLEFPLRNEGLPRAEIDRRVERGGRASCASSTCSARASAACPAATASASRWAAPSCASPRPS